METYLDAFLLGFLGGAHCFGMCGALSAAVGASCKGRTRWILTGHWSAYLVGKTLSYTFLGVLAASVGMRWLHEAGLESWRQVALWVAVLTMVLTGMHTAGWLPAVGERLAARFPLAPGLRQAFREISRSWSRLPSFWGPATLGMLNGFLPCGLVFAAVLMAGATAHPLQGAAVMAIFGLATAPALLLPAFAGHALLRVPGNRMRVAAGLATILLGLFILFRTDALVQERANCCDPPPLSSDLQPAAESEAEPIEKADLSSEEQGLDIVNSPPATSSD